MLEQGVDRIVAQVVDPKVHHTFRPQVERVVRRFLSPNSSVEDDEPLSAAPPPPTDNLTAPDDSNDAGELFTSLLINMKLYLILFYYTFIRFVFMH